MNKVKRPEKMPCARCLRVYKLSDMADNKVSIQVIDTLLKEPAARDSYDWIEKIEKNYDRLVDEVEGCFLFCTACYLVTVRDIDMYEVSTSLH